MAETDKQEAERELARARASLARSMDHLGKYAPVIREQIREGVSPDGLLGPALEQALSSYRRVRTAEDRLND